jgi:hypothetical protein
MNRVRVQTNEIHPANGGPNPCLERPIQNVAMSIIDVYSSTKYD